MFYKALLTGLLSLALFGAANAQTYWLNIVIDDESMSLPVSSNEKCSEAIIRYVQLLCPCPLQSIKINDPGTFIGFHSLELLSNYTI